MSNPKTEESGGPKKHPLSGARLLTRRQQAQLDRGEVVTPEEEPGETRRQAIAREVYVGIIGRYPADASGRLVVERIQLTEAAFGAYNAADIFLAAEQAENADAILAAEQKEEVSSHETRS